MYGLGKHVHRLDDFGLISFFAKDREISRKGARIAGDIDDAAGGDVHDRIDRGLVETFTRGVDDDDIDADAFVMEFAGGFARIAGDPGSVGDLIALGVLLGVFDRFGDDFHTDDLFYEFTDV